MPSTIHSNIILTDGDGLTFDPTRCIFKKTFPRTFTANKSKIGLLSLSLFNSWNNLTTAFNNTTGLSYIINSTTYPVVYPEGSYSIDDLSGFLAYTMELNGHYLVDEGGEKVFYISWITNPIYYSATLKAVPIPSALPTGYTNPMGLALTGNTPQIVISPSTNFGTLIGFEAGTYPATPQTVETRINSTKTPEITSITTILVQCNWINSGRFTAFPSTIASFTPNVSTGELIAFSPQVITTYDIVPRDYNDIEIQLVDSHYRPLQIKDTSQIVITLLLEEETV